MDQAAADSIRKTEARQEKEAVEHNQLVGREIDELYVELGIDGSVNCESHHLMWLGVFFSFPKNFRRLLCLKIMILT